ncbi:class I SAM-dependent methyltransferase [Ferruginibacter lapsinanis]|uniref:O-methyltransferase n=1 Tax=Ferruginibacter lapsinanis TaxID=563172 RepID=UPI001E5AAE5D|nr:class I SAM-dependent methyltransferase [Ferruginibacter lapsinanis]UEG51222.1 class I SAM-dependent methyltransferase [Ferruginibacter lapsinanis]
MYSSFQLAKKYLNYRLTASNGKGHGVHSPFVFDFIKNVLRDKKQYDCYTKIEAIRKELLLNKRIIQVEDFGAGSTVIKSNQRMLSDIAASSLKPKKYAQLLYRMVQYYQPKTIIELGTSLGVTTSYLASGNTSARVYTCEGAKEIASVAKRNFDILNFDNIEVVEGDFTKTLPTLFDQLQQIDFAFVDGNHRKEPTLDYFTKFLNLSTPSTILVFDDIHWSKEMEEAWTEIQQHPAVTLTIDLFFVGIVCINTSIKAKQHFSIIY